MRRVLSAPFVQECEECARSWAYSRGLSNVDHAAHSAPPSGQMLIPCTFLRCTIRSFPFLN